MVSLYIHAMNVLADWSQAAGQFVAGSEVLGFSGMPRTAFTAGAAKLLGGRIILADTVAALLASGAIWQMNRRLRAAGRGHASGLQTLLATALVGTGLSFLIGSLAHLNVGAETAGARLSGPAARMAAAGVAITSIGVALGLWPALRRRTDGTRDADGDSEISVGDELQARASAALAAEQARFRQRIDALVQVLPESLLVYDAEGHVLHANDAFTRLVRTHASRLGYSESELREVLAREIADAAERAGSGQIRIPPKRRAATGDAMANGGLEELR